MPITRRGLVSAPIGQHSSSINVIHHSSSVIRHPLSVNRQSSPIVPDSKSSFDDGNSQTQIPATWHCSAAACCMVLPVFGASMAEHVISARLRKNLPAGSSLSYPPTTLPPFIATSIGRPRWEDISEGADRIHIAAQNTLLVCSEVAGLGS